MNMKELSIEEKAKAYDEALSVAQETYTTQPMYREWLAKMFPELKESEGEKTKKEILDYIIKGSESYYDVQQYGKEKFKKWIAWLERQGEQKPVWSEEDEEIVEALNDYTKNLDVFFSEIKISDKDILSKEFREKVQHWLKSLKDRVGCEVNCITTKEWSEDDEQYLLVCKNALRKYERTDKWDASIISHWLENKLKSVNPQNTWKPSDEHLRVEFAHRPNKYAKVWNYDLGEEQIVEVERYGKGEWNTPNVKYWLDCSLPNTEEE